MGALSQFAFVYSYVGLFGNAGKELRLYNTLTRFEGSQVSKGITKSWLNVGNTGDSDLINCL